MVLRLPGEMVGPEGYPNNQQYFRYYTDQTKAPRQVAKHNYGALLMRLGPNGTPVSVGRSFKATIRGDGMLYFDINEATSARGDNKGALALRIVKGPSLGR